MKDWILKYDGSANSILKHALLWLIFYLLFSFLTSSVEDILLLVSIHTLNVVMFMIAYYCLRYLQIPRLYKKGHKWLFLISLMVSMLFCYSFYWGIRITLIEPHVELIRSKPFTYFGEFLVRTLRFYSPAMLLIVWEFQHDRIQHQRHIRLLEKEKLSTELKFLKAQINPHFLFNTLNNLYSFVVTESPKASDMLTRLTGILEYVFDRSEGGDVSLQAEVDTIENYLALEEIRYGERLEVKYQAKGNLDLPISPLILLSIIENAFKHGASGDINNPKIDIDISAHSDVINCTVWNTKTSYKGEINDAYKSGIGLSNIRRQLDLIYPKKHQLNIDETPDTFTLSLSINTAA